MSVGTPSTAEALLHKEASINGEPTVSWAPCVAQHCCPGKINSLQLGKFRWQPPMLANCCVHVHMERFLSAGACSLVRKDGCVSRDTGKETLSSESPTITKQHMKANKLG